MNDSTFMRIIPREPDSAGISSYIWDGEEVKDEIQRLAYDVFVALNESPEHIFLAISPHKTDIEVHSVFGKDKKFKYDVIVHGFGNNRYLLEYLCMLGRSEFVHV